MNAPKRVGWEQLKKDFLKFGMYGNVWFSLPLVYGEASLLESSIISEIAWSKESDQILEIGRCRGYTTLNLALASPDAHIITLDLPTPESIYKDSNTFFARTLWNNHAVLEQISEVLIDSKTFKPETKFDLVYIDGGHDYKTCASDINLAIDALNLGGVCLIHDYNKKSFPGVTAAVAERADALEIKWINNSEEYLDTSLCYFIKKV